MNPFTIVDIATFKSDSENGFMAVFLFGFYEVESDLRWSLFYVGSLNGLLKKICTDSSKTIGGYILDRSGETMSIIEFITLFNNSITCPHPMSKLSLIGDRVHILNAKSKILRAEATKLPASSGIDKVGYYLTISNTDSQNYILHLNDTSYYTYKGVFDNALSIWKELTGNSSISHISAAA
jgi:hypothetical protein